jgi:hypothetical protein
MFNVWCSPWPTTGNWWNQWGCYGRLSMPYMLLLKVPEHAYDHHRCLKHSSLLFLILILFSFRLGLSFSCLLIVFCSVIRSEISIILL